MKENMRIVKIFFNCSKILKEIIFLLIIFIFFGFMVFVDNCIFFKFFFLILWEGKCCVIVGFVVVYFVNVCD